MPDFDPARLRALHEAGSKGPWTYGGQGWVFASAAVNGHLDRDMPDLAANVYNDADADLIVAAVNALPDLIDRLEAVKLENRRAQVKVLVLTGERDLWRERAEIEAARAVRNYLRGTDDDLPALKPGGLDLTPEEAEAFNAALDAQRPTEQP